MPCLSQQRERERDLSALYCSHSPPLSQPSACGAHHDEGQQADCAACADPCRRAAPTPVARTATSNHRRCKPVPAPCSPRPPAPGSLCRWCRHVEQARNSPPKRHGPAHRRSRAAPAIHHGAVAWRGYDSVLMDEGGAGAHLRQLRRLLPCTHTDHHHHHSLPKPWRQESAKVRAQPPEAGKGQGASKGWSAGQSAPYVLNLASITSISSSPSTSGLPIDSVIAYCLARHSISTANPSALPSVRPKQIIPWLAMRQPLYSPPSAVRISSESSCVPNVA